MTSKLIVVVGATGRQGGSVVSSFLALPGWKVRGVTRNVQSESAQKLISKGVDMINGNLDDVASLKRAFEGAHVIFAATDFWTGFYDPANKSRLAPGQTLLEWAHDYELQQGMNIFEAASECQGLQRLIFSALSYATKWSQGTIRHVYHFDSSARAVDYAQKHYQDLMKKTSLIQVGMYLTNILLMPHYQPKKLHEKTLDLHSDQRDSNGVYVFEMKLPHDCKIPFIATIEDTGPLTKALLDTEPGKHLLGYREMMSFGEFATIWGRVMGVKTKYVSSGRNSPWARMPEDIRLDIEDGMAYLAEFGYDGGDPSVVHPSELGVPVSLPSVEAWVAKQDWSAVIS